MVFTATTIAGTLLSQRCAAESTELEAQTVLQMLRQGNQRFVMGQTLHSHQASSWRMHLAEGQMPIATVLGCSDSRVPPELVFDQGLGDLFVVRVAGNVFEPTVQGSISYAVEHLRTKLLVVLGHEKCGAVTAALAGLRSKDEEPNDVVRLLKLVEPSLTEIDRNSDPSAQVANGIEANVRYQIKQINTSDLGQRMMKKHNVTVAGGVYELNTGRVRFL
jgi:carbonic anhydrase